MSSAKLSSSSPEGAMRSPPGGEHVFHHFTTRDCNTEVYKQRIMVHVRQVYWGRFNRLQPFKTPFAVGQGRAMTGHSTKNRHLLFVYGTLKQGQPNHYKLMDKKVGDARYICRTETVEKWPLVIATRFHIPYLLGKPGLGHNIRGELYEVDNNMLDFCDKFEDSPTIYQRTTIDIKILDGEASENCPFKSGQIINCFSYVLNKYSATLLQKTFIADYNDGEVDNRYNFVEPPEGERAATLKDLGIIQNASH